MCKVLKVSKSGYYRWNSGKISKRAARNQEISKEILQIHEYCKKSYGSPRMQTELEVRGYKCSRVKVKKLMRVLGVRAKRKKKFVVTTDSDHQLKVSPNMLKQNFRTSMPGKVWVSDLTYIRTKNGWSYLTVILDLYDRKVVGWSLSKGMKTIETTIPALRMALINRTPEKDLIFHSDRGVQYCCAAFRNVLAAGKITRQSMSRKGNCWDNAVAESFFKSLKVEWVYLRDYKTIEQAELSIFEWIETWYNKNRRHSFLNNKTIDEFHLLNNFKHLAA